jgi:hypothetical protein
VPGPGVDSTGEPALEARKAAFRPAARPVEEVAASVSLIGQKDASARRPRRASGLRRRVRAGRLPGPVSRPIGQPLQAANLLPVASTVGESSLGVGNGELMAASKRVGPEVASRQDDHVRAITSGRSRLPRRR